jgi:hypothetical protein
MTTGGAFVQTGRTSTEIATYTGSLGNDTFMMFNKGDVLDGGAGTGDTLNIDFTGILGGLAIDLSSATDQVGTVDGVTNTVVQKGFENVELTGYTGFGASITGGTGANSLTGTVLTDSIAAGKGADTLIGGSAADTMSGGAGADIFKWTGTTAALLATETGAAEDTDNDFVVGSIGDKVSDFTTASDKFHFAAAGVTNAIGTEVDTLISIGNGGTVTNVARFVEVTVAQANGQMGTHIAELDSLITTAVAVGDSFIAFLNDGTDGYLYIVQQASVSDTIAAADVTLIGQVTGVTNVANGDFVSF